MHSYTTDNAMGLTYSTNEFPALNRIQMPPSAQLNYDPDPEVHEDYQWSVHDLCSFP